MKQKSIFILLVFLVFATVFCSCKQGDGKNDFPPLESNVEYTVGLKINGFETKGLLTLQDDGTVHFFHTDPNSDLFTMEEVVTRDSYTADFQGIKWESGEVTPAMGNLYPILETVLTESASPGEQESLRGIPSQRLDFEKGENKISFYRALSTFTPLQIHSFWEGNEIQINFEIPGEVPKESKLHNMERTE